MPFEAIAVLTPVFTYPQLVKPSLHFCPRLQSSVSAMHGH